MNINPYQLIDSFTKLNIIVIGDAMLDSYLEGAVAGICREAPVPVVTLEGRTNAPGGAANTAANVHALGAHVRFLSVIGNDSEGQQLRASLEVNGISTEHLVIDPDRATLAKHRVVASSQLLVRFDQGSTRAIGRRAERELITQLGKLFLRCDALIISDYGYGVITPGIIRAITRLQAEHPHVIAVDSRRLESYRHIGVTLVKPNYTETTRLLGVEPSGPGTRAERVALYADRILDITGSRVVAITLDAEGALICEHGRSPYRTYASPTRPGRVAGAGDTFISVMTLALATGTHPPAAADLASAAAMVVTGRDGTTVCSSDELRAHVIPDDKFIPDVVQLAAQLDQYRQQGRRIVFTNGCFDILHRGHITYLNRAKSLGDILVIGVNSDDSIRRLKGSERPINTLDDRVQVLAALSCVDHLVGFGEDTPIELIRALKPDVFVKGGDYTRATLPEAEVVEALGGVVHILPYVADRSTTRIIDRIRAVGESLPPRHTDAKAF